MPNFSCHRRTVLGISVMLAAGAGCVDLSDETDDETPQDDPPPADDGVAVETVVEGLSHPWGLEPLPDDTVLVTERDTGDLLVVDPTEETAETIEGTPPVSTAGQGGLLDVATHPDFPSEAWVYLTYAATDDSGQSSTHLGRGLLDTDAGRFDSFETLFVAEPFLDATQHYGSRVVFDDAGYLYMTTGDRGDKTFDDPDDHVSQDTTNTLGATLRLEPDGSIPADNPFRSDPDVADAIYSYGHRNSQGMTVHPETGDIWQSEHGEQDGDELNVVEAGGNYGWPATHTGCEYGSDDPVGDHPETRDDIVDPVFYWECNTGGFPPAGMTFYDGEAFPEWQGDLFLGGLASQYLARFSVDGRDVELVGSLLSEEGWRIRDVAVGGAGELYVAIDADDVPLVRLVPE